MNEIATLIKVRKTPSKNNKIDILIENDSVKLRKLLNLAFNPFLVFGLKKLDYTKSKLTVYSISKAVEFVDLANYCANHNTDDNKRLMVKQFLDSCPNPQQGIYADILLKKLRIGATVSTCNKAFGKGFIPEFKIMLADTDDSINLNSKKIVQEKYDGVRCIIIKRNGITKAFTRQGKLIPLTYIEKVVKSLPYDNILLDGELTHGNRTETTSITSKLLKGNVDVDDRDLIYNIFDMIPYQAFAESNRLLTEPLHSRLITVEKLVLNCASSRLQFAETHITNTKDKVMELYNEVISRGGEGLIVKDPEGLYQFKRHKSWAKFKQINYCTLEVVNIIEGTGKHIGKLGAITCTTSDGKIEISVGTGFTDELRESMWAQGEAMIGRFVEVKFNELQWDREGKPYLFLPVFIETRVDKTEADSLDKIIKETNNLRRGHNE